MVHQSLGEDAVVSTGVRTMEVWLRFCETGSKVNDKERSSKLGVGLRV